MTSSYTHSAFQAERSAKRWARALFQAAFGTSPDEVTATSGPFIPPTVPQFTAYPSLNQAPLSIALAGIVREPAEAPRILAFAQRFETALKISVAPITSEAAPPFLDEHPDPVAAACARGDAGALTVIEHERNRRQHQQPWMPGDRITLALPGPPVTTDGILVPPTPITAVLTGQDDGLEVVVSLSPTRDALAAKLTPGTGTDALGKSWLRWIGTVARTMPPFGLELRIADPGFVAGQPFTTASWMLSDAGFAIRIATPAQQATEKSSD